MFAMLEKQKGRRVKKRDARLCWINGGRGKGGRLWGLMMVGRNMPGKCYSYGGLSAKFNS